MKDRKNRVMSKKDIEALSVKGLSEHLKPVFREAEKKRRWQETDNIVKKLHGYKPESVKEDEFSYIADKIYSCWCNQDRYKSP